MGIFIFDSYAGVTVLFVLVQYLCKDVHFSCYLKFLKSEFEKPDVIRLIFRRLFLTESFSNI